MLTYIKGDFLPRLEDDHVESMFSLRQFKGWLKAERVRDTYSWAWNFGFDLQQTETSRRCWVCKMCVLQKSRKPGHFQHTGLQNALSHLYNKHQIQAPGDKPESREEKLAQSGPVALRSIATIMGLNTRDPAEQAFINKLIERFDHRRFQQMLTEWIVARNVHYSCGDFPNQQRKKRDRKPAASPLFTLRGLTFSYATMQLTTRTDHGLRRRTSHLRIA
ncbi:PIF1-like helicase domain-containing protein [Apiospora kogelbergensis]|uniref:PIF1-like helicase domain-containing protein n=1 Tax=Apiospora kogelbergensis TaxID=1337665 RepID=UPI00312E6309